jgi:hypothetical protein
MHAFKINNGQLNKNERYKMFKSSSPNIKIILCYASNPWCYCMWDILLALFEKKPLVQD